MAGEINGDPDVAGEINGEKLPVRLSLTGVENESWLSLVRHPNAEGK